MEVVSQAAHFFRLLFTPCVLWLDEKPSNRRKYVKIVNKAIDKRSPKDDEDFNNYCGKTWASYDNPQGEPDWSMVPDQLLDELDKLNGEMLNGLDMFSYYTFPEAGGSPHFPPNPYWDAVKALLSEHIVNGAEENVVTTNILAKLRWYTSKNAYAERLWVPILTPKMLDALATYIKERARAYEEVSDMSASIHFSKAKVKYRLAFN